MTLCKKLFTNIVIYKVISPILRMTHLILQQILKTICQSLGQNELNYSKLSSLLKNPIGFGFRVRVLGGLGFRVGCFGV